MSDEEMLQWAAKAAGLDAGPKHCETHGLQVDDDSPIGYRWWNPLTDDGDALRLAIALNFQVHVRCGATLAIGRGVQSGCIELWDDDKGAATRRAIVGAAAEIGRKIEAE